MTMNDNTILYFAYGSNLNLADVDRYCCDRDRPTGLLRPLGRAWLPDRKLAFTHRSTYRGGGTLNIMASIGHVTEGVVMELDDDAWRWIDLKEGARGGHYQRVETEAILPTPRAGQGP